MQQTVLMIFFHCIATFVRKIRLISIGAYGSPKKAFFRGVWEIDAG
jgi:hypothetical protein